MPAGIGDPHGRQAGQANLAVKGRLISIMQITVHAWEQLDWTTVPSIIRYTAAAENGQMV